MYRIIPFLLFILIVSAPVLAFAEEKSGCSSEFLALYDAAVVELKGQGEAEVVVVTDPMCWHCRLGHKLLGEYPELYRTVRMAFFTRKTYPGSDMAAWVLEDAAGTDRLQKLVDFAYSDLKKPKAKDLVEARVIVLMQFTEEFPELLEGTTLPELAARLKKDHEPHTLRTTQLARAAELPGTPILIAGEKVLLGFGPGPWLDAIKEMKVCK